MKAIVFGGSGFLGSHVADTLSNAKHDVVIFDKTHSPYLRDDQKMVIGDILDPGSVLSAMKGCSLVYHFAGIADMDDAKQSPLDTVKNNILGTAILLDASVKTGVNRFIFASTVYVYSDKGSFYRSSKQACELLIENYKEVYGLSYTVARYASLYGPRADKNNWISGVLRQALEDRKITRYGDGEELREYIHVIDAARLSVEILSDEYENENVIISGHQPLKIKDLLTMLKEILGGGIEIEYKDADDKDCPYDQSLHYEITPYSFSPKIGKKLVSRHYLDMGQGILDLLKDIHPKLQKTKARYANSRKP